MFEREKRSKIMLDKKTVDFLKNRLLLYDFYQNLQEADFLWFYPKTFYGVEP